MSTEDDADAETDADADAATPTFCEVKVGPLYFALRRTSVRPYWKQRNAVRFIVTFGVFALMLAAGLTSFHAFLMASGALCYVRGVLKI